MDARNIEFAFAAEMAAHCAAAAELNPYAEAECLELGDARAVYCGAWSPVHGVCGLGLDGPVEERDLAEVERFFHRKERPPAFWLCPATDPSLGKLLARDYRLTRTVAVHGIGLAQSSLPLPEPMGNNKPDLNAWALDFTHFLDPGAKEPGLLALTKLHQKDTRFYSGLGQAASYTFFSRGIALVPAPSAHSLLALQAREAGKWGAAYLAAARALVTSENASVLPLVYERTLYERL